MRAKQFKALFYLTSSLTFIFEMKFLLILSVALFGMGVLTYGKAVFNVTVIWLISIISIESSS